MRGREVQRQTVASSAGRAPAAEAVRPTVEVIHPAAEGGSPTGGKVQWAAAAPLLELGEVRFTLRGLVWPDTTAGLAGEGLSASAFLRLFRVVLSLHQASNWLLGDALVLAERRWGNRSTGSKYEEASQRTGLSLTTLRGIACTCRAYPLELRHGGLSFSHHREAMMGSSSPELRERWLSQAEREGMSCAAFRRFVRAAVRPTGQEDLAVGRADAALGEGAVFFELSRFALWAKRHRADSLPLSLRKELWERLEPVVRYGEELRRSLCRRWELSEPETKRLQSTRRTAFELAKGERGM